MNISDSCIVVLTCKMRVTLVINYYDYMQGSTDITVSLSFDHSASRDRISTHSVSILECVTSEADVHVLDPRSQFVPPNIDLTPSHPDCHDLLSPSDMAAVISARLHVSDRIVFLQSPLTQQARFFTFTTCIASSTSSANFLFPEWRHQSHIIRSLYQWWPSGVFSIPDTLMGETCQYVHEHIQSRLILSDFVIPSAKMIWRLFWIALCLTNLCWSDPHAYSEIIGSSPADTPHLDLMTTECGLKYLSKRVDEIIFQTPFHMIRRRMTFFLVTICISFEIHSL